ncbi:NAD-dependent epimerase/dehydratase family protein [Tardiphaga sp.]|jgi:UDP-glucose 4-epimerase|uniref:NAD-dependent epimerase/dehydratase family protein n=1 Tax=Tardiphaga sp. TaxID=1926292 RepID=UPI0037DA48D1
MQPIVLVTGASGFVGRNLPAFLRANGYAVRGAMRSGTMSDGDVAIDSIGHTTDWSEAVAGIYAVVHLAARVHHPNEEHADELYTSINTDGTLHLARAAARAGARKFIFLSSILVNGSCTDGRGPFTAHDQLRPRGVYGRSKAAAELGLAEVASSTGMDISIVRPPLVHGRDAVGNFKQLAKAIRARLPLPFGLINNRRAFIGVDNLCSFIATLVGHAQDRACATYLVADAEQVSIGTFVRQMGMAMNRSPVLLPIPPGLLDFAIKAVQPTMRDSLLGSLEMDTSAAISTGWVPPFSLDEGLRRALGPK